MERLARRRKRAGGSAVAVGVGGLPGPGRGAHVVDAARRPPSEDLVRPGGVREVGRHVSGAARADAARDRDAARPLERRQNLHHRGAAAGSDVERLAAGSGEAVVQRRDMGPRQIDHVDVVALPGSVAGVVVVAEDGQAFVAPGRDLRDQRHEVVGDAAGVLADAAGFMRAGRVEVAQQDARGAVARRDPVADDLLDEPLALAVGVDRRQPVGLVQRDGFGNAVDARRGREHDPPASRRVHGPQELEGSQHVVLVVAQGLRDGFADRLETGEVHDGVGAESLQGAGDGALVEQVEAERLEVASREIPHAIQRLRRAVAEIVDDADLPVAGQQLQQDMGADVARAARENDLHRQPAFLDRPQPGSAVADRPAGRRIALGPPTASGGRGVDATGRCRIEHFDERRASGNHRIDGIATMTDRSRTLASTYVSGHNTRDRPLN